MAASLRRHSFETGVIILQKPFPRYPFDQILVSQKATYEFKGVFSKGILETILMFPRNNIQLILVANPVGLN